MGLRMQKSCKKLFHLPKKTRYNFHISILLFINKSYLYPYCKATHISVHTLYSIINIVKSIPYRNTLKMSSTIWLQYVPINFLVFVSITCCYKKKKKRLIWWMKKSYFLKEKKENLQYSKLYKKYVRVSYRYHNNGLNVYHNVYAFQSSGCLWDSQWNWISFFHLINSTTTMMMRMLL